MLWLDDLWKQIRETMHGFWAANQKGEHDMNPSPACLAAQTSQHRHHEKRESATAGNQSGGDLNAQVEQAILIQVTLIPALKNQRKQRSSKNSHLPACPLVSFNERY